MRGNPHALFGKRPTEKDPNHGHLAGGRLHSAGGHGKRTRGNPATAPVPDPTAAPRRDHAQPPETADHAGQQRVPGSGTPQALLH